MEKMINYYEETQKVVESFSQFDKEYFEKNPSKLDEVLNQNESYVFFKLSN